MSFGFGLQRELVAKILHNDRDRGDWTHDFGKCLEVFTISGTMNHRRLFEALVAVLSSEKSLHSPPLGWPVSEPFEARRVYSIYREVQPEAVLETLIESAAPVVAPKNDLSKGAQPFVVYVVSRAKVMFCIGGDHAYLDGYSLRVILRRAADLARRQDNTSIYRDGLENQRSFYVEPEANREAQAFFDTICPALQGLGISNGGEKRGDLRQADQMKTITIEPNISTAIDKRFEGSQLPLSSGWHLLFQAMGSAWCNSTVPMLYSKAGRSRVSDMSAVGPFYQSSILGSSALTSDWDSLLARGKRALDSTPNLRGGWGSDWLGLEAFEDYRLLSFNYLSPERGLRLEDALLETAPGDIVGVFLRSTNAITTSRNGIHGAVSKLSSGSYELWLRVDESLAGPIDNVCEAFREGILSFSRAESLDQFIMKVRNIWNGAHV